MKKTVWWAAALGLLASCAADGGDDGQVVPAGSELVRMTDFVKNRIDPSSVRMALQTKDGRRVDCVDIATQPALAKAGGVLEKPPVEVNAAPPSQAELAARKAVGPEALFDSGGATAACPN